MVRLDMQHTTQLNVFGKFARVSLLRFANLSKYPSLDFPEHPSTLIGFVGTATVLRTFTWLVG